MYLLCQTVRQRPILYMKGIHLSSLSRRRVLARYNAIVKGKRRKKSKWGRKHRLKVAFAKDFVARRCAEIFLKQARLRQQAKEEKS